LNALNLKCVIALFASKVNSVNVKTGPIFRNQICWHNACPAKRLSATYYTS